MFALALVVTPPDEYDDVLDELVTSDSNSAEFVLYPVVCELAMLSLIIASAWLCEFNAEIADDSAPERLIA
jgi:hypothetical protein